MSPCLKCGGPVKPRVMPRGMRRMVDYHGRLTYVSELPVPTCLSCGEHCWDGPTSAILDASIELSDKACENCWSGKDQVVRMACYGRKMFYRDRIVELPAHVFVLTCTKCLGITCRGDADARLIDSAWEAAYQEMIANDSSNK